MYGSDSKNLIGFWILDFGFWILDFGFWILDFLLNNYSDLPQYTRYDILQESTCILPFSALVIQLITEKVRLKASFNRV